MSSNDTNNLVDALTRLDQDIAEAERRLAELRAMRESVRPFIDQYVSLTGIPSEEAFGTPTVSTTPSITDAVVQVFRDNPDLVFDVDDVWTALRNNGSDSSRVQVRNAINYVVRVGRVPNKGSRRGTLHPQRHLNPGCSRG